MCLFIGFVNSNERRLRIIVILLPLMCHLVTRAGMHKAYALYKCIEEGVSHMWTVSALQLHPR